MKRSAQSVQDAYRLAQEQFSGIGVDTESALKKLGDIRISMHCWQGDDVSGFERAGDMSKGGIMATGNYPGRARNGDELRMDIEKALTLIPGRHRINLHMLYAETNGSKVDRSKLGPEHFARWADWAKEKSIAVDFNPSFFAHPKADSGFTLSNRDKEIRKYWIEHGIASRKIAEYFGKTLGETCITNFWMPDGFKDTPADRKTPRELMKQSLDEIFAVPIDSRYNRDAVESKLFGIGSESYVVGSHEFFMGYAVQNKKILCLDMGHFHPTETIADKISSMLMFVDELLLHVSRGIRWDSDHIVVLNDDLRSLAQELVRCDALSRVHIALDYFDASVNRIAAWTIGMRATQKALLQAILEPTASMIKCEAEGDYTGRLALMEAAKVLPYGAVWDYFCLKSNRPLDLEWIDDVRSYEKDVLLKRQ